MQIATLRCCLSSRQFEGISMMSLACLAASSLAACSSTFPTGTAITAAGLVKYQVPSAIATACSVDVTVDLQKWIASVPDTATLVFGKNACYRIDGGLFVTDRHLLTLDGNGSTFRLVSRGDANRSNWTIRAGTDITLRNMTAQGANPQAGITDSAYDRSVEWQHAYRFEGTQTGTLDNVRAFDVFGDFVEAQSDWTRVAFPGPPARNISVRNSHFERSGRQGVGLTHVDGFALEDSYFGDVNMTGIDIEPGAAGAIANNIRVERNTFGRVRHAVLAAFGANAGNVTFSGNVMAAISVSCMPPVYVGAYAGTFWSGFTFEDNTLKTLGNGFDLTRVKNVRIRRNSIEASFGGCGRTSAVLVSDAHDGIVSSNSVSKSLTNSPPLYTVFQSDSISSGFLVTQNILR